MAFVIVDEDGAFWTGAKWVAEYPAAYKYVQEPFSIPEGRGSAWTVEDYGLETERRWPVDEIRPCGECKASKRHSSFSWTHDRYGNPWRKVCDGCHEKVSDEIAEYVFDPADAGESLDEE